MRTGIHGLQILHDTPDRWLFPKLIKIEIRESSEMGSVIFQYMKGVSIEDYKKNFSVGWKGWNLSYNTKKIPLRNSITDHKIKLDRDLLNIGICTNCLLLVTMVEGSQYKYIIIAYISYAMRKIAYECIMVNRTWYDIYKSVLKNVFCHHYIAYLANFKTKYVVFWSSFHTVLENKNMNLPMIYCVIVNLKMIMKFLECILIFVLS